METKESSKVDSDHQAAEIARGVAADGESAGLRSVLARISELQADAFAAERRATDRVVKSFQEGKYVAYRNAADLLKVYVDGL